MVSFVPLLKCSSQTSDLIQAIGASNVEKVQALLATGLDVNQRIPMKNVPKYERTGAFFLAKACASDATHHNKENKIKILRLLLQAGANPNVTDDYKETVFHSLYLTLKFDDSSDMSKRYAKTCVALLLLWGADPTIKNHVGHTALDDYGLKEKEIFDFGALIQTIQNYYARTALRYTFIKSDEQVDFTAVREFLELNEDERFIFALVSRKLNNFFPKEITDTITRWTFGKKHLAKYTLSLNNTDDTPSKQDAGLVRR